MSISNYYIKETGWGYAIFLYGNEIPGTERETREEVEELLAILK